jgi:hypothetical protein
VQLIKCYTARIVKKTKDTIKNAQHNTTQHNTTLTTNTSLFKSVVKNSVLIANSITKKAIGKLIFPIAFSMSGHIITHKQKAQRIPVYSLGFFYAPPKELPL